MVLDLSCILQESDGTFAFDYYTMSTDDVDVTMPDDSNVPVIQVKGAVPEGRCDVWTVVTCSTSCSAAMCAVTVPDIYCHEHDWVEHTGHLKCLQRQNVCPACKASLTGLDLPNIGMHNHSTKRCS